MNIVAFIASKTSAHTVVWDIPQQLKTSLFHFIRGVAVWRGVERKYLSQTPFSIDVWCLTFLWSTALWFTSGKKQTKKHQWTHLLFCSCRRCDTEFVQSKACCFFHICTLIYQDCIWCNIAVQRQQKGQNRNLFSPNGNMESCVSPSQCFSCPRIQTCLNEASKPVSDGVSFLFPCLFWVADC